MKHFLSVLRVGAVCVATASLLAIANGAEATVTNDPSAATASDVAMQVDALKAQNVRLQAQLRDAELAVERNRHEYEETARAQAAAITEKLSAIQGAIENERLRQQEETQRSNRTLLWVASAFGAVGLIAMLFTALFQWRAMSRLAEVSAVRAQLPAPTSHELLPMETGGLPGKMVELSNQRLMSVLERLERRVFELEHTAAKPLANTPAAVETAAGQPASEPDGTVARITLLLGKGQSFLNADKPEEALECYDEILTLDGNHPEALVKKGAALERLKKDEEALNCYDRAIAADGSLTIAYLYKGGVYNRLERYNEALECYEQALRAQGGTAP